MAVYALVPRAISLDRLKLRESSNLSRLIWSPTSNVKDIHIMPDLPEEAGTANPHQSLADAFFLTTNPGWRKWFLHAAWEERPLPATHFAP